MELGPTKHSMKVQEKKTNREIYLAFMEQGSKVVSALNDGTSKGDKCQKSYLACMELRSTAVSAHNDGTSKGDKCRQIYLASKELGPKLVSVLNV